MQEAPRPLLVGQSADPDDAFMAWALEDVLRARGFEPEISFADIEQLNRRALQGRVHLTALSVAAYPGLADRYRILRAGASFGDGYGPVVVARPERAGSPLHGLRIAIPGRHTTAATLLRLYGGRQYEPVEWPFDRILDAVRDGSVDAGMIIHEGQLLYERLGLACLLEPAAVWRRREGLPLPLGVVVVSRELPEETQRALAEAFHESLRRAFAEPEAALAFAARYARGLDRATLREYVRRYVDEATLEMGAEGERALQVLFERARAAGLLDAVPPLDLL